MLEWSEVDRMYLVSAVGFIVWPFIITSG